MIARLNKLTIVLLSVLTVGVIFTARLTPVKAGVSGNNQGSAVYQGLLTVTSDVTQSLLEIGNNGQEIASNSNIYLRPSSLTQAQGVRFSYNSGTGRTNLYAPGGLCFDTAACVDTWPSGTGSAIWNLNVGHYVVPITLTDRLEFVKSDSSAIWSSLDVYGQRVGSEIAGISNTGGPAARFTNYLTVYGNINALSVPANTWSGSEIVFVRNGTDYPVWHAGNDGHNTGLDASYLDTLPIYFRGPVPYKLCADFTGAGFPVTGIKCVTMTEAPATMQ